MATGRYCRRWFFALVAGLYSLCGWADDALTERIVQLDEAYQNLAGEIYAAGIIDAIGLSDPAALLEQFNALNAQAQTIQARQLIYRNLQNLAQQPDHSALVEITDSLLDLNERRLCEQIYDLVNNSGDETNLPYIKFNFAKYHAGHQQWQVIPPLLKDGQSELSGEDANYAYLLQGSAQQHLKQHRSSVDSYKNITTTSIYYVHAQLNTALANIRQGWITEARLIIEKALDVARNRNENELTNRIFLVLGYALLQKEYFRDARKAFRNIGLDSEYTNRALMGLALTAISQGDYVAGLNVANALKQRQQNDLSSDEAYLVVPYIYEKLDQALSIEGSFSESVDHYQTRLLQLSALKRQPLDFDKLALEAESGDLLLDGIRFDFAQQYPRYLLRNRQSLAQFAAAINSPKWQIHINKLLLQHDDALSQSVNALIDQRIKFINSYLNQSRYGLARHYDKQQEQEQ